MKLGGMVDNFFGIRNPRCTSKARTWPFLLKVSCLINVVIEFTVKSSVNTLLNFEIRYRALPSRKLLRYKISALDYAARHIVLLHNVPTLSFMCKRRRSCICTLNIPSAYIVRRMSRQRLENVFP